MYFMYAGELYTCHCRDMRKMYEKINKKKHQEMRNGQPREMGNRVILLLCKLAARAQMFCCANCAILRHSIDIFEMFSGSIGICVRYCCA